MKNFEVKGLDKLVKLMATLPDDVVKQLTKEGLANALEPMRAECERTCPVDTGSMKSSFTIKPGLSKGSYVSFKVHIGDDNMIGGKYYAPFVIYGHGEWAGDNFMVKSFEAKSDETLNLGIEAVQEAVDKYTKGG